MNQLFIFYRSNNTNNYNPQEHVTDMTEADHSSNNTNNYNPQELSVVPDSYSSVQIIPITTILKNCVLRTFLPVMFK